MAKKTNVKDKSLANSGERMIPAYSQEQLVYGEHIIRYEAAKSVVGNKRVLDIASGSGYGSKILGEVAKSVIGVDVDQDSINYAKKNYSSDNVKYLIGDGKAIPLEDNTVDVVVSFETIEHIDDYRKFMEEVKRVLAPDGLFILSTPNDLEYPEGNHFHLHEFTPTELKNLVKKYFSYSKDYYQATWLYNALVPEELLKSGQSVSIDTLQLAPIGINESVYLYMLCSEVPINMTIKPLAAMSEHWSERKNVEKETAVEAQRSGHIATIRRLEKTIDAKHEELLDALGQLELERHKLRKYGSKAKQIVLKKSGLKKDDKAK